MRFAWWNASKLWTSPDNPCELLKGHPRNHLRLISCLIKYRQIGKLKNLSKFLILTFYLAEAKMAKIDLNPGSMLMNLASLYLNTKHQLKIFEGFIKFRKSVEIVAF